jgi:hypothetical protein
MRQTIWSPADKMASCPSPRTITGVPCGRSSGSRCCVNGTRPPVYTVRVVALYGQQGLLLLFTTFARDTTSCPIRRAGGVRKAPRGGQSHGKGPEGPLNPQAALSEMLPHSAAVACRTGDGAPHPDETRLDGRLASAGRAEVDRSALVSPLHAGTAEPVRVSLPEAGADPCGVTRLPSSDAWRGPHAPRQTGSPASAVRARYRCHG